MTVPGRLEVRADPAALAEAAAERTTAALAAAQAQRGRASLVLAGGSTPRALYRRLAADPWRGRLDWRRLELFWGDERLVPPDHPESNQRMAREALLEALPEALRPPAGQIHPIAGALPAAAAAARYDEEITTVLGRPPRFDVTLLGVGDDGHTASLFPGALGHGDGNGDADDPRLARAAESPRPPHERVTLTVAALAASHSILFLVAGAGKAAIMARLFSPAGAGLPAARVATACAGEVRWLLDEAAAAHLHPTKASR